MKNFFLITFTIAAILFGYPFQSTSAAKLTLKNSNQWSELLQTKKPLKVSALHSPHAIPSKIKGKESGLFHVNVLDDTDDGICDLTHCSLREAIQNAHPGDTIDFEVNGTIELDGTSLTIDKSLIIEGPGEDFLTISANTSSPSKASRVFYVYSDTINLDVAISGLSISNGYASTLGGGIYNEGENLTILNCMISHNSAKFDGGGIYNSGSLNIGYSTLSNNSASGGAGGGIYNEGTLNINNSTISGNLAANGAGGGVYNSGSMTVDNSTFFDNHADGNRWWGGGIANVGTLTLNRSTLSANSAESSGSGLRHKGDSLTLANTIIANSIDAGDCTSDTAITDGGYNLIEGTGIDGCGLINGTNGNIIGLDPLLTDALGDYGGPTLTLAILFISSPAIDAIPDGVNSCIAGSSLDQRDEVRAGGTDETGFTACDIGAFEFSSGAGYILTDLYLPVVTR